MQKYKLSIPVVLSAILIASLLGIGCSGCVGVKNNESLIVEKKDSKIHDSTSVIDDENNKLTAEYDFFKVYNFDTLSKYSNPEESLKVEINRDSRLKSKAIYPLKELSLFKTNEVVFGERKNKSKSQYYSVVDTGKEREEQMHLTIVERDPFLLIKLTHYEISGFSDVDNISTEFIFYDTLGNKVLQLKREGEVTSASISKNGKYAFLRSGGSYTEDTFLPYRYALYDIENKTYLINKQFERDCLSGNERKGTKWAELNLMQNCDHLKNDETLFFNTHSGLWYYFNSSDCQTPLRFKKDQFNCHSKSLGKQIIINPEKDFRKIDNYQTYIDQLL